MYPPDLFKGKNWRGTVGAFSPIKYVFRVRAPLTTSTIPESEECDQSSDCKLKKTTQQLESVESISKLNEDLVQNCESSIDTTSMSTSPCSSQRTLSTNTSRMENGEPIPRLAPGIYHRRRAPILTAETILFSGDVLPHPSECLPVEMRGPPPAWQPPHPPDRDHEYENNYEDPEDIKTKDTLSRGLLLESGPPPTYNSYELSLSQQRRSTFREPVAPPLDDWSGDEEQRILHKNAEGTYYIPGGSVRTATSMLSPSAQNKYFQSCPQPVSSGILTRITDSEHNNTLIKYSTSISGEQLHKRRSSKIHFPEKSITDSGWRPSSCSIILAAALFISLIVIVLLIFRSPSYVYSELAPSSSSESRISVNEKALRPLPSTISMGQYIDADIVPKHMATTEFFVSRAGRVVFNISMGTGAQLVLLGRHAVPPTLSLHDFFHPLRAEQLVPLQPNHNVEVVRSKRDAVVEMVAPRSALFEHFLMDGRWHLVLINERNRVEPIGLIVYPLSSHAAFETHNPVDVKCDNDCHSHGECVMGRCHCGPGYTGETCEEPICPVVCSGNGVFSGGVCVCRGGFKGKECDVRSNWCEIADCNGHGRCGNEGVCHCEKGWMGEGCELHACPHPTCNDRGLCHEGRCYCSNGWTGIGCATAIEASRMFVFKDQTKIMVSEIDSKERSRQIGGDIKTEKLRENSDVTIAPSLCSYHGQYLTGVCNCEHGWTGRTCEISVCSSCVNGVCSRGICLCQPGWTGASCDRLECAIGCEDHGICHKNGSCICKKGWNGDNCYFEGCPRACSNHGECKMTHGEWRCECQPAFTGQDCSVPVESECLDGLDNDNDGLTDCDDPECCSSLECQFEPVCSLVPSPTDVLLRLPSTRNANLYHRVGFLIRNDSVQSYSDHSQFDERMVSVIRGRIMWNGGAGPDSVSTVPLSGVRVSDASNPLYGFTLSRMDGEFDLLVNGGRTINLQFLRSPFQRIKRSVYVAPNEIVVFPEWIMMSRNKIITSITAERPNCAVLNRAVPFPVIKPAWKMGTEGIPMRDKGTLLVDTRSVVESVPLPGSSLRLVYDSSRVSSSHSYIVIGLLPDVVDPDLRRITLIIDVAGRRFEEKLAPTINLTHLFLWDKQNVYRQNEYGLVTVNVRIGYEYRGCEHRSEIIWVRRIVQMEGARARWLDGNAWSINIHHHLDVVKGVLEMGNGGRRFISSAPPVLDTVIGSNNRRSFECKHCDGPVEEAVFFRPSALAHGLDGSLFIGDHNFIRCLTTDGRLITVLSLSQPDTLYPYYLAVNPVDGSLFLSLPLQKQIWKIVLMQPVDTENNHEVFAGDGSVCPFNSDSCGDGGPAINAQLFFPKGIAFNAQGDLYVADGPRLRIIDSSGQIRSIGDSVSERPHICGQTTLTKLQLEWPTSVSVHLPSGLIYVLDSNVVYELDHEQNSARVVLGSLTMCHNSSSFIIKHAKDISASIDGSLYVVESDGKKTNQVRRLSPDRTSLSVFAGRQSECACDEPICGCDDLDPITFISAKNTMLNTPSAVSVDSRGRVYIADSTNAKVKRISQRMPLYDSLLRQYNVVDADRNEAYSFNRHGLHISTHSLTTGKILYNFTYNVDTSLGRLSSIHGSGGFFLRFIRLNETHTTIETPSGQRTQLMTSIYDGSIETIQTGAAEPTKLHYAPGALLLSRNQGGATTIYEYDKWGRAMKIRIDGVEFKLAKEEVISGRVSTSIFRNRALFATFSSRDSEVLYEESSTISRIISMDDGFSVVYNGITLLIDANVYPMYNESNVLKVKTSIDGLQNLTRRALTTRFEWRPYTKRDVNHRLTEIGSRIRVNGINSYTVVFDLEKNRDIIRSRNDDALLWMEYTDSGELKSIGQGVDPLSNSTYRISNLTIQYDSLGRRNALRWGKRTTEAIYDRQNRVMERTIEGGGSVKFSYSKDIRFPVTVELADGVKYSIKYDSRGRLREISTPTLEVHHFSSTPIGNGRVLKRRYPFTMKPFLLAEDLDSNMVEWATADGLHHVNILRDVFGSITKVICNGMTTSFFIVTNKLVSLVSDSFQSNITWQGPLVVSFSEKRKKENSWSDSSFSLEHDDQQRPTFIQSVIEGTAVEPIQFLYDDRSGLLSSISGYQIFRESEQIRVQGHKMTYEATFDAHRCITARKIIAGDIRLSLETTREKAGRVVMSLWRTPNGEYKETTSFDAFGRLATFQRNDRRWSFTYNLDGRPLTMNEIIFDWYSGGVPRKVGKIEYEVDGNGWTIKRGAVLFELDAYGRLITAQSSSMHVNIQYDHMSRVISIRSGDEEFSLFYALIHQPLLISHFYSTSTGHSSILYTDDGFPFALARNGFRYSLFTDEASSLRYIISESGIVKEILRDPLGAVVSDSAPSFWIPLGYLGGIDLSQISIVILPGGRPFDTLLGRYLSFGPTHINQISFSNIAHSTDLFALEVEQNPLTIPHIPTDIYSWFRIIGISPAIFSSNYLNLLSSNTVLPRAIASFPSRLTALTQLLSISSSKLLDSTFTRMSPPSDITFTLEDIGFYEFLVLNSNEINTTIDSLPILTSAEHELLTNIIGPAVEVDWCLFGTSWERHFVRSDLMPSSLTSSSHSHFTLITSRDTAELRNGKTKLFVHYGSNKESVNKFLEDDLRRKEGPAVWRAEKKRIERGESKNTWTDKEKRELLSKGVVPGYMLMFNNSVNARFPTIHLWHLVKQPN